MPQELKTSIDPTEFASDYLFGLVAQIKGTFSEDFLFQKLRAAEDEAEHDLGILLTEKRIRSEPGEDDDDYDIAEPAYDFEALSFLDEHYGYLRLRRGPVHRTPIPRVIFAYPNLDNKVFEVPSTWIKFDHRFGMIRLVPAQVPVFQPFTAAVLACFTGGRGVPQAIYVDYTAGFNSVQLEDDWQDLLAYIRRSAILAIATDALFPSSGSISADGLSQSAGFAIKDYREDKEKQVAKLRNKLWGLRFTVV